MEPQIKKCQNCKKDFILDQDDFSFYEKMKVPSPTFCPECRLVRRLLMRNERSLYKRKCDLCGTEKIFVYSADSKFKVYCKECFQGDNWDPSDYAKDYDFSGTFFDQFIGLYNKVPKIGIVQQGFIINSEYTNRTANAKNCYLTFASADCENCSYSMSIWGVKDSMDCLNVRKSERCFDCIDCYNCNSVKYSMDCNSCIDSNFLKNCKNCQNCFGCVNLRNKNYCIFNEQYKKEEYQNKIKQINLTNIEEINDIKEAFYKFSLDFIRPYMTENHSVDVSGNWIDNSKNVRESFSCDNIENGKYLFGVSDSKDVMDYTYWGKGSQLIYDTSSVGYQCSNLNFCNESWNQLMSAEYCHNCFSSSNLFGCVGLKNKQYCILNKQYSKEEYFDLVNRIKKQMVEKPFIDNVGRIIKYGEFFPSDMTPFAYNETIAQEYVPKSKEEAVKSGYRWKDIDKKTYIPTIMGNELPNVKEVSDDILSEIIGCIHKGECNEQCTLAFKITKDELSFYKNNDIPLPNKCPNCRHYTRLAQRNPLKLWDRECMCTIGIHGHDGKCKNKFKTSFSPNRKEIVFCKDCYKQEVY